MGGGYQPQRVTTWEHTVGWQAKEAMREREPITGHVAVRLVFVLKDNHVVDLDNLSKAVLDGLKGIAFGDDCNVVKLASGQTRISKRQARRARGNPRGRGIAARTEDGITNVSTASGCARPAR